MARRPKSGGPSSEWLNTYADMVTLLLCFFVLLFAMSSVSSTKWMILVGSLNPNARILVPIPMPDGEDDGVDPQDVLGDLTDPELSDVSVAFKDLYEAIEQFIAENMLEDSIQVERTADGLVFINFQNDIMFDGDSSVLRAEARPILDALALSLRGMDDYIGEMRIVGHTNRISTGRPNNISADRFLSSDRATRVLVHLQETGIIDGKKMRGIGLGEFFPVAPHDSEADARKNRRVEIFIMQDEMVTMTLEELYREVGINVLNYE